MKKPLSFIVLLAMFLTAGAGPTDCKFDADQINKITRKRVVASQVSIRRMAAQYGIIASHDGDEASLSLIMPIGGEHEEIIHAGTDTCFVRLENGRLLKLRTKIDIRGESRVFGTGYGAQIVTYYSPTYPLSAKRLSRLAASPIVAISVHLDGREFLIEMSDKKSEQKKMTRIMESFRCISEIAGVTPAE